MYHVFAPTSEIVQDFGLSLDSQAYLLSAHVSSMLVAPVQFHVRPTATEPLSVPCVSVGVLGATGAMSSSTAFGDVMIGLGDNPLNVPTNA